MMDWLQRATYEAPGTVMLGELASALIAGFAELVGTRVYLTAAGQRYLDDIERERATI